MKNINYRISFKNGKYYIEYKRKFNLFNILFHIGDVLFWNYHGVHCHVEGGGFKTQSKAHIILIRILSEGLYT